MILLGAGVMTELEIIPYAAQALDTCERYRKMIEDHIIKPDVTQKIEDFIKTLGEEELRYLNRLIVERLKLLHQQRSTTQMQKFNIGEKVRFNDSSGTVKTGTITRLNKKTVSLVTTGGEQWNVAPALLTHCGED